MMEEEQIKEFKKQHFDNYKNNILDINTNYSKYIKYMDEVKNSSETSIYASVINSKNMGIENILVIKTNENIMYIDLNSDLALTVLTELASSPANKVGYDVKIIYKEYLLYLYSKGLLNGFLVFILLLNITILI
jgi:hypothetical protein